MTVKRVSYRGKGRQIPAELIHFIEELEKIVEPGRIGLGIFSYKGSSQREIKKPQYDEIRKILTITFNDPEYRQTFTVSTDPEGIRPIYELVKNYKF